MKQLICAKEMEQFLAEGKSKFLVTNEMIITPSAKDVAKLHGIEFTTSIEEAKENKVVQTATDETKAKTSFEDLDKDMLMDLFKAMMNKGILQEMLETLSNTNKLPYDAEIDKSGLKVVRGKTVKMDVFDTGNPNATAYYQELVSKDESQMSAGFLVIEDSKFEWELTYEEIDYVIEGTLTIEIDGKTYTAKAGDVLFVPKNSKVVWGSPDKARVFYSTYPANWADLL